MVDLKAKPFYLSDSDVEWVQETIRGMRQLSTFLALLADRFRTSEEES